MLLSLNDRMDADRWQIVIQSNDLKYAEYKLLIFNVIDCSSCIIAYHLFFILIESFFSFSEISYLKENIIQQTLKTIH